MEAPKTLADALDRMAREPGVWKPFAGGTDLMVLAGSRKTCRSGNFLSLWKLPELRGITATPQHLTLGALTTYSESTAPRSADA